MDGASDMTTLDALDETLEAALDSLKSHQKADGHWVFELEADATIPAEYILLNHFLDEREPEREAGLARYLRKIQNKEGGWPLFYEGESDLSASVKAYYALKLAGDAPDEAHMVRARTLILKMGGAEKANIFTRYTLALFGQVPWRAVPVMPIELMLMPRWFPVHMGRFSYWSRTVIAPLLVLATLKPVARNPEGVHVPELFTRPPEEIDDYIEVQTGKGWERFFVGLDKVLRGTERYFPKASRQKAMKRAVDFFKKRLNGVDGLGAIFPAMANATMALDALGERDSAEYRTSLESVRRLVTEADKEGALYCQPCVSPIWDTALAAHALVEAGEASDGDTIKPALDWLKARQILDVRGDWASKAKDDVLPGGWAFQYANDYYPDTDDTAVVGMILDRAGNPEYEDAVKRAAEWLVGVQSSDGGWGAFDVDNNDEYLNYIPFADHGALLDPPTSDVTARCVSFLAQLGYGRDHPAIRKALTFLKSEQERDGSWYGRWGTNYIYGTWSVLCALNMAGVPHDDPAVRRAVEWLISRQRKDGGWGEGGETYWEDSRDYAVESTPSQTAWAVLGLMAAGEVDSKAVRRGIEYLIRAARDGDKWAEPWYTAVGFPRVFYLRYDGYSRYFPVWALARYRNLKQSNSKIAPVGM